MLDETIVFDGRRAGPLVSAGRPCGRPCSESVVEDSPESESRIRVPDPYWIRVSDPYWIQVPDLIHGPSPGSRPPAAGRPSVCILQRPGWSILTRIERPKRALVSPRPGRVDIKACFIFIFYYLIIVITIIIIRIRIIIIIIIISSQSSPLSPSSSSPSSSQMYCKSCFRDLPPQRRRRRRRRRGQAGQGGGRRQADGERLVLFSTPY